ncbi:class I SAM-dependent methyltransferase [Noviherbaspirillum humi]|nr:methyltransferase domain-containing protein [Noviherbaspirillum humi]
MKTFLHVGCGPQNKYQLKGFGSNEWAEIRFDIDGSVKPDIVGSLTDMSKVGSGSVDAIYSAHNIEHLFPHEVPIALGEFYRVLKPQGFVVITCPDLVSVCEAVVKDRLLEPLYQSPAGPISPIDILYGHRGYIAQGNEFMAHKCGFTYSALCGTFRNAGFKSLFGGARPAAFDLWLFASKAALTDSEITKCAPAFLP